MSRHGTAPHARGFMPPLGELPLALQADLTRVSREPRKSKNHGQTKRRASSCVLCLFLASFFLFAAWPFFPAAGRPAFRSFRPATEGTKEKGIRKNRGIRRGAPYVILSDAFPLLLRSSREKEDRHALDLEHESCKNLGKERRAG